jgi:hypothetical protein
MYIHNYPAVANKINLFRYSNEATVYPNWVPGNISGLNPEVFTNNDTVTIEGKTITVSIDFSGINASPRLLGDAGGIYGGSGRCDPNNEIEGCCEFGDGYDNRTNSEHCRDYGWPFCNAYWGYALPSTQGGEGAAFGSGQGCKSRALANFNQLFPGPDGKLRFPYRVISGISQEDGNYWNNPTLWNNGFANTSAFLAEHDGPKHGESGGYEYVLSLGHPITTQPCRDEPYTFNFWDHQQNTFISRKFRCPCVAWGTSVPCQQCPVEGGSSWPGIYCSGDDGVLTADFYRLWIMDSSEPPIPNYIKRYKLLKGQLPEGLPSYSLRRPNLISKEIVKFIPEVNGRRAIPDLNIPGSYGHLFVPNVPLQSGGEGDDGQIVLTVTEDGETIVKSLVGGNFVGAIDWEDFQRSQPITGENRCNDIQNDLFFKNGDFLDINSWCLPDVYHRDELPNPKLIITKRFAEGEATSPNDVRVRLNVRLEQLGKPKLVFYSYPSSINEGDSITLPEINENNTENFPLKTSPYLSRESLNDVFRNTNVVAFRQQKMLQASELNEIQEKFYRKQKLLVEHTRNWLTRENIIQNPNDLLCTSGQGHHVIFRNYRLNKCLPIEQNKITIDSTPDQFALNIDPTYLLLNSDFKQGQLDGLFNFTLTQSTPHKSLNFYKLQNRLTIGFTVQDLPENDVKIFTIGVDYGNLISCNEYSELRDNSGGSNTTAPCGADRNVLIDKFTNAIISLDSPSGLGSDNFAPDEIRNESFIFQSPVNNYSTRETNVPFMVAYMIKQNNNIKIYYPNGLLISGTPIV